jgi:hypothetical protein
MDYVNGNSRAQLCANAWLANAPWLSSLHPSGGSWEKAFQLMKLSQEVTKRIPASFAPMGPNAFGEFV